MIVQNKPLKILHLEEEPFVMFFHCHFLKKLDDIQNIVENAESKLEVSTNDCGFVLMDTNLLDVDCIEVTTEIKYRVNEKNKKLFYNNFHK